MKRAFAVLAAVVLMIGLVSGTAAAQETRSGDRVVIEEGETVGDLEAFAGSVVVRGTVNGDLSAFGGDVVIEETGTVTGGVEAFAGNVRIAGEVGGEASAAAGNVVIAETATVGTLSAASGNVVIDGTVEGDVEAAAGSVTLGPGAVVEGDLTHGGELQRHPDAVVAGTVTQETTTGPMPVGDVPSLPWWLGGVYWLLVNLLLGAILLAVFPAFSDRVATAARTDALKSGGVGLLALVGIPVALVVFAITVIGIPVSIAGAVLFALLVWAGSVYGRVAVGAWLLSLAGVERRWAALIVGLIAVLLVGFVPILGGIVEFLVLLLGLGALVLALYGRYGGRTRPESTSGAL